MAINLRIFLILLIILGSYLIIKTIKTKKLSMIFGLYWTIILIFLLILVIFPNIIEYMANILGFVNAPNMLFLLAIFIISYKVFSICGNISKLNENSKDTIQELSILKYELENKKRK